MTEVETTSIPKRLNTQTSLQMIVWASNTQIFASAEDHSKIAKFGLVSWTWEDTFDKPYQHTYSLAS